MKLLIIIKIYSILVNSAFAKESFPKIPGVLVQVEFKEASQSKEFKLLTEQFSLFEMNYFSSLKVYFYSTKKPKDLSSFCSKAIKISGVKHCEINYKLKPQNETSCTNPASIEVQQDLKKVLDNLRCEIVPQISAPHKQEGLSTYWAQEYTGADLVREKLKKNFPSLALPKNLIGIWDSRYSYHGDLVSNIVAGPHESALIPKQEAINFTDLENTSDYILAYEEEALSLGKDSPHYLNNSMSWLNSHLIAQALMGIASNGTVVISGAGNDATLTESEKTELASQDKILLVGSLDPDGFASEFTSFSPEIAISAPSDHFITSFDKNGAATFGGTSGATPQVTGALAAFTLISGYQLSTSEARKLLEKTAIKFPHYPIPTTLGPGMLNSYKIVEVASKITLECKGQDKNCIKNMLQEEKTYHFIDDDKELLKRSKILFPECHGKNQARLSEPLCEEKKDLFKELRKAALLEPGKSHLWNAISCISSKVGMTKNAEFYSSLGKREEMSDKDLIANLLKKDPRHILRYLSTFPSRTRDEGVDELINDPKNTQEIARNIFQWPETEKRKYWIKTLFQRNSTTAGDNALISFVLSQPGMEEHPEFLAKMMENKKNHYTIISRVLAQPHWVKHYKFVSELLDLDNDYNIAVFILTQPHWTSHPELVEKLIQKGTMDDFIKKRVLSMPEWQKVFRERLGKESAVSLEDIRSLLKKK